MVLANVQSPTNLCEICDSIISNSSWQEVIPDDVRSPKGQRIEWQNVRVIISKSFPSMPLTTQDWRRISVAA